MKTVLSQRSGIFFSSLRQSPAIRCSVLDFWRSSHVISVRFLATSTPEESGKNHLKHPSPINVDTFTLNEELVSQDLKYLNRWNEFSARVDEARASRNFEAVLKEVEAGLEMLKEIGEWNSPLQCETLLHLEASQALYNLKRYPEAYERARSALSLLETAAEDQRDAAKIAEVKQLIGYILIGDGKEKEAETVFREVLHWIDVDAKKAMPMQAVAAVNLRRTILQGLGESLEQMASNEVKNKISDGKKFYGQALDRLIEALNAHVDEGDSPCVKKTLASIAKCFEGTNDLSQAVTTCQKYIGWCKRQEDSEGVTEGEKMLEELCARHQLKNPNLANEKN